MRQEAESRRLPVHVMSTLAKNKKLLERKKGKGVPFQHQGLVMSENQPGLCFLLARRSKSVLAFAAKKQTEGGGIISSFFFEAGTAGERVALPPPELQPVEQSLVPGGWSQFQPTRVPHPHACGRLLEQASLPSGTRH